MHRSPRLTSRDQLAQFEVREIVAGSRGYDDYPFFSKAIIDHIKRFGDKKHAFISGGAPTGADALIIRWCEEHNYPYYVENADWDNIEAEGAIVRMKNGKPYNVLAGYWRNSEMAKLATDLVTFYDGVSKGTRHMVEAAIKRGIKPEVILIDIIKKENDYGHRQSKSSRSSDSGVRGETVAW